MGGERDGVVEPAACHRQAQGDDRAEEGDVGGVIAAVEFVLGGGDQLLAAFDITALQRREPEDEPDPRVVGRSREVFGSLERSELATPHELDRAGAQQGPGDRRVAGPGGAAQGFDRMALGVVPGDGATVELGEIPGLPAAEPRQDVGAQQFVRAVVLASPVGGGDHPGRRLESFEGLGGVVAAGQDAGEGDRQR